MSIKTELHSYINAHTTVSRDDLRKYCRRNLGVDLASCDRKLRELTEEKKIKPTDFATRGFITEYSITKKIRLAGR